MVRMERSVTSLRSAINAGKRICSILHGIKSDGEKGKTERGEEGRNEGGKGKEKENTKGKERATTKNEASKRANAATCRGGKKRYRKSTKGWRRALRGGGAITIDLLIHHATNTFDHEILGIRESTALLAERIDRREKAWKNGEEGEEENDLGEDGTAMDHNFTLPMAIKFERALENLKEKWTSENEDDSTTVSWTESVQLSEKELEELRGTGIEDNSKQDIVISNPTQDVFTSNLNQDVFTSNCNQDVFTSNSAGECIAEQGGSQLSPHAEAWIPANLPPKPGLTVITSPDVAEPLCWTNDEWGEN